MPKLLLNLLILLASFLTTVTLLYLIAKTGIISQLVEKYISYETADTLTKSFDGKSASEVYTSLLIDIYFFSAVIMNSFFYSIIKTLAQRYRTGISKTFIQFSIESLMLTIKPVYFFLLIYLYFYFLPFELRYGSKESGFNNFIITTLLSILIAGLLYFFTHYIIKNICKKDNQST